MRKYSKKHNGISCYNRWNQPVFRKEQVMVSFVRRSTVVISRCLSSSENPFHLIRLCICDGQKSQMLKCWFIEIVRYYLIQQRWENWHHCRIWPFDKKLDFEDSLLDSAWVIFSIKTTSSAFTGFLCARLFLSQEQTLSWWEGGGCFIQSQASCLTLPQSLCLTSSHNAGILPQYESITYQCFRPTLFIKIIHRLLCITTSHLQTLYIHTTTCFHLCLLAMMMLICAFKLIRMQP